MLAAVNLLSANNPVTVFKVSERREKALWMSVSSTCSTPAEESFPNLKLYQSTSSSMKANGYRLKSQDAVTTAIHGILGKTR
jgi:hypothetical protein